MNRRKQLRLNHQLRELCRKGMSSRTQESTALIDDGADVNGKDRWRETALIRAIACGDEGMAELLVSRGADLNVTDRYATPALMLAIGTGRSSLVKSFIRWGAELNVKNNLENTPVIQTIYIKRIDLLEMLLEAGADPNILDRNGNTALHVAAEFGEWSMQWQLIKAHADVSARNSYTGMTPAMMVSASIKGRFYDGDPLLNPVSINMRDFTGNSALTWAAKYRNWATCQTLIRRGAMLCREDWGRNDVLRHARGRISWLASKNVVDEYDVFRYGALSEDVLLAAAEEEAWDELARTLVKFPELYARCASDLSVAWRARGKAA